MGTTGEYELTEMSTLRIGPPIQPGALFRVTDVVRRWVASDDDFKSAGWTIIARDGETTLWIPVTDGALPEVGDVIHASGAKSNDEPFPGLACEGSAPEMDPGVSL